MIHLKNLFFLIVLIFISSCSLIESTRKTIMEEDEPIPQKTVPQAQYDELVGKYEVAARESETPSTVPNADAIASINNENPPLEKIKMEGGGNEDLVETVDVFAPDMNAKNINIAQEPVVKASGAAVVLNKDVVPLSDETFSSEQVKNDILLFRKGKKYLGDNDYDNALAIYQTLEKSPIAQVRVRSKAQIAEILFKQGNYDLAMQVHEEILSHYAFSGVVINSLRQLIICSEKLNLKEKKEKYTSMLTDIFERT
ncbi:MAG: hypothetical protein JNM93_07785 [Bacteriovoracaceae bacterium]|nr:hypothetical protein [Bacteriovoracaceae bacterium]